MILPLLLATALVADGPVTAQANPEKASAKNGPTQAISWAKDWDDAVAKAHAVPDTRILVFLAEDGCGECDRQYALVAPSASFASFVKDKVPVAIAFSSFDGKRLARRFGIGAPPAWIVLTPEGLLCGIHAGPTNQQGWLDNFVRTEQAWAEYKKRLEREQKDPTDLALVYMVAEETYKRGGDEAAESRFRRLVEAPNAGKKMREQSYAYLATIEMDSGRIEDAAKDLEALLAATSDESLRERAELRMADVEIARGRRDHAAARLKQFKKDHPESKLVSEADALLARLGPAAAEEEKK